MNYVHIDENIVLYHENLTELFSHSTKGSLTLRNEKTPHGMRILFLYAVARPRYDHHSGKCLTENLKFGP